MMTNAEYWKNMLWSFGILNDDHIIIYDNSDLYSSCRLWFALKYFGHEKVSVLDGGLKKWIGETRSVNSDIVRHNPIKKYKVNEKSEWIKNKKQIDENIKNSLFQTVDARSRERFAGKIEEPRPGLKKGCIIGSKNIPFQECIDKKKMWTLLEKYFGAICIKLPDASVDVDTYLFVCGPNKKCREVTNAQSFMFFSPNKIKEPKKPNPLEMSSLRLAG